MAAIACRWWRNGLPVRRGKRRRGARSIKRVRRRRVGFYLEPSAATVKTVLLRSPIYVCMSNVRTECYFPGPAETFGRTVHARVHTYRV